MKAIIFANGELELPPDWEQLRDSTDLIIAADGGSKHILELGLKADLLVGDLDSISADEEAAMESGAVEILPHPVEKDQTDLELALFEAKKRGAKNIVILAGLGRRWDHSLANILLVAQEQFQDITINFLHGEQNLFMIRDEVEIRGAAGMQLSLIPLGGHARAVHTQGLQYSLENEDLFFGSSRGVSNVFVDEKVRIKLGEGRLLAILSPANLM